MVYKTTGKVPSKLLKEKSTGESPLSIEQNLTDGRYTPKTVYTRETRDLYYKEESELVDLFKKDLELSHGLSDHPKKDLLFQKAWQSGHASGLHEVANFYADLAILLKD